MPGGKNRSTERFRFTLVPPLMSDRLAGNVPDSAGATLLANEAVRRPSASLRCVISLWSALIRKVVR